MRSTPLRRGAVIAVGVVMCLAILAVPLSSPVVGQDTSDMRSLDVTVSVESTYVSQGESVVVDVIIQNAGDESSPAPVFDMEEFPSGWTVSSWSNADATYRSDTNEWLWTELEGGGQEQLRITLQASDDASGFSISGELTDGYDNTADGEDEIIIDSEPSSTPSDSGDGGDGSDGTSSGTSDTTNDDTDDSSTDNSSTGNTSNTNTSNTNTSNTNMSNTNMSNTNTSDMDDSTTDESTGDSSDDSAGDDSSDGGATDSGTSNNGTSDDETTGDSTPGFGVTVALAALIATALIITRRKR